MKMTLVKTLKKSSGVSNWEVGVVKIDWEPGVKWYGGLVINGTPDPQPGPHGGYCPTKRAAISLAESVLARLESASA